ncbi:MAG: four helix bundle protein [Prevotella sp.]|nr:four helix bundle protein [Prevotella sp.]
MKDNLIVTLSLTFSLRVIKLIKFLNTQWVRDYTFEVLSKQLIRSGTSIGANISESQNAQSKQDFISKLCIALKEADETKYWLTLLNKAGYLDNAEYEAIINDNNKIIGILVTIIKKTKDGLKK